MPTENKCPHCGKPVSPDALMGLCPDCMLKAGAGSGASSVPGGASTAATVPPTPAELARYFPQLEILELLGRGGMGAVYKARQKQLDRFVALKILPPSVGHDPAFADRFAREAKALAKLNHPSIVTLYEFGQADGLFYFLMEFVDGVNLRQLLNAGRLAPREALAIVPQICDALQYAHDQGIVHRDIKPENILLDRAGRVKVADFGLAKLVGVDALTSSLSHPMGEGAVPAAGEGMPCTTEAGQVIGTPQYMAPEQVRHPQEVDHRADIYSLGVVFYQMLTGELPAGRLEPPSKKVVIDVRLDEVVLRALEKEPERRYQQASVLKTEVETIAGSSNQPSARPQSAHDKTPLAYAALFFAGLSGVLGIVAFCLFPNPPEVLVWSILVAALAGVTLGIRTRKTRPGKQAIVIGSINTAIWLAVALAVNSTSFQIHVRELAHLSQWPERVIAQTIQHNIGRQLRAAGATYDDLQVSVAIHQGSARPKVSYRGLQNFKGADGTIPDANGEFIMNYIGGGQWQGAVAGTQFTVTVGSQDNIDLPFVSDSQVVGEWKSVDFVVHPSDFHPDKPNPPGGELFLKGLTFLENGKMPQPSMTWTRGVVMNHEDKTASHYEVREMNGKSYMFFEWKSGDYTISGMKPYYYVLEKSSSAGALSRATEALTFGPVTERVLPADDSDPTDLLDLDSGKIVKAVSSDAPPTSTAAGVFFSLPSSQLIASSNAAFKPVERDDWESLTAPAASLAIGKLEFTAVGRREYVPDDQLPKTIIFKTRAGGMGLLQITGFNGNHHSVYIRYKLVQDSPGTTSDFFSGLATTMKNPQERLAIRAQLKVMVDQMYAALPKYLNLPSEQLDALKNLLLEERMAMVDARLAAVSGTASDQKQAMDAVKDIKTRYNQKIKDLLGQQEFLTFQDYEKTVWERMQVQLFENALTADSKLTGRQEDGLIAAMYEERQAAMPALAALNNQSSELSVLNQSQFAELLNQLDRVQQQVLKRASAILTPAQLDQFGKWQAQTTTDQKATLKQMFADTSAQRE